MKAALFHRFSHWNLALPLTTDASRDLGIRSVLELRLECERGSVHAEAAPLPGLHGERVEELPRHLPAVARTLSGLDEEQGARALLGTLEEQLRKAGVPSSLVWALGWAWFQAAGLVSTLPRKAPESAALLAGPASRWVEEWRSAGCPGTVKVKVARASQQEEAAGLAALCAEEPGLQLRLDANGRWSLPEALRFHQLAHALPVEFVEDPLAAGEDRARFREACPWPLALDLRTASPQMEEKHSGVIWVIKPQVLGLGAVLTLLERAQALGEPPPVLSSCFESPRGLLALCRLAALVPHRSPGLGTSRWFTGQVRDEAWRLQDPAPW